jgi:hypothetical protein
MQMSSKIPSIFLILLSLLVNACATTRKGKLIEGMVAGAAAGALYGATRERYPKQNALLIGSIGGLAGTAVIAALDDSDKEIEELKSKLKSFSELQSTMEIEGLSQRNTKYSRDEIIFKGGAIYKSDKIPGHVKGVLTEGEVIGFKTDQWIDFGSNKAAHIDEIWEYSNPEFKLNPN